MQGACALLLPGASGRLGIGAPTRSDGVLPPSPGRHDPTELRGTVFIE